tara:strand:+ start:3451 stop:4629 length:1179 start_codon:yes stop_codon:yes gene_type:complete
MHYYIFSTKDTWLNEMTSSQNYGGDEILELSKNISSTGETYALNGVTRILSKFNLTGTDSLEELVSKGLVPTVGTGSGQAKVYLRLYNTEASELSTDYTLSAHPIGQDWEEGPGKFHQDPVVKEASSWEWADYNTSTAWSASNPSFTSGSPSNTQGGGIWTSGSNVFATGLFATQSFSYESPDVNMDVTDICRAWLNKDISNYGFLLKFSGSQETDSSTSGNIKFFSKDTNTIYAPKLEVRWDDHSPISHSVTGSMTALDLTGEVDNILYVKRLRPRYKEGERVRFRVGGRKRYIDKTFTTSIHYASSSFVAEGSGSYSIIDQATGDVIVPFEVSGGTSYTQLSADSSSMYFTQYLDTFEPNRIYKILLKLKTNDGQEQIFDDDWEFAVVKK